MLLKQDGSVWAAGRNEAGQLGDGSETSRNTFVQVMSSGARAVSAGYEHSMVLKQNTVWAVGNNPHGMLGDGSKIARKNYAQVFSSGAQLMATGKGHSMVLKTDGSLWVAGENDDGQLGDGSNTDTLIFVPVTQIGNGTCT